jgi:hypothetical protein
VEAKKRVGGFGVAVLLSVILLAACDSTVEPDPSESLHGTVVALTESGVTVPAAGAIVTIRNDRGEAVGVSASGDGLWTASDLGPGPYLVQPAAPGYTGLAEEAVTGGTSDLLARLVQHSSVRMLRVNQAAVSQDCGSSPCLDLSFTVAEETAFPEGVSRRIFRVFIGDSDSVSPNAYLESLTVIVADDDPLIERGGSEVTIGVESLRGFDLGDPTPSELFVYVAGATEHSVIGLLVDEMAALGFPDLSASGASARVGT